MISEILLRSFPHISRATRNTWDERPSYSSIKDCIYPGTTRRLSSNPWNMLNVEDHRPPIEFPCYRITTSEVYIYGGTQVASPVSSRSWPTSGLREHMDRSQSRDSNIRQLLLSTISNYVGRIVSLGIWVGLPRGSLRDLRRGLGTVTRP